MATLPITAIYASTSGNTELVIESVADQWRQGGMSVELHRAEQTEIALIASRELFLFGTSTWEHGRINPFFDSLLTALKTTNCAGKHAAFVGLGDTRYEPVLFCGGLLTLRDRWQAQGGAVIGEPLLIDGEPHRYLTTTVADWARSLLPAVQKNLTLPGAAPMGGSHV